MPGMVTTVDQCKLQCTIGVHWCQRDLDLGPLPYFLRGSRSSPRDLEVLALILAPSTNLAPNAEDMQNWLVHHGRNISPHNSLQLLQLSIVRNTKK